MPGDVIEAVLALGWVWRFFFIFYRKLVLQNKGVEFRKMEGVYQAGRVQ